MAGKPGAKHVAPRIRGAFLAALDPDKGGLDIHTLMKKSLEEDFLATLNAVSKYVPRELLLGSEDSDDEQVFRLEVIRPRPAIEGVVVNHERPQIELVRSADPTDP